MTSSPNWYIMPHKSLFMNEYIVKLHISGFDMHPDTITKSLGILPSEILVKGDYRIVGKKEILNQSSHWYLKSELSIKTKLEDHIDHLLQKLKPHKQAFLSMSKTSSIVLECSIYYYDVNPNIQFTSKLLNDLSSINCTLSFDIYCLVNTVNEFDNLQNVDNLRLNLSNLNSVKKYGRSESKKIITSLKDFEKICRKVIDSDIPDFFWEQALSSEEYYKRLRKISAAIKKLNKSISKSSYFNSLNK